MSEGGPMLVDNRITLTAECLRRRQAILDGLVKGATVRILEGERFDLDSGLKGACATIRSGKVLPKSGGRAF